MDSQTLPFSNIDLLRWLKSKEKHISKIRDIEVNQIQNGQSSWDVHRLTVEVSNDNGTRRILELILKSMQFMPEWFGCFRHFYSEVLTFQFLHKECSLPLPFVYASSHKEGPHLRWILMGFVGGDNSHKGKVSAHEYLLAVKELARFHGTYWRREDYLRINAHWLKQFSYAYEMESFEEIFVLLRWAQGKPQWSAFVNKWNPILRDLTPILSNIVLEIHKCPYVLQHGDACGSFITQNLGKPDEHIVFFDLEKAMIGPVCLDLGLLRQERVSMMSSELAKTKLHNDAVELYRTELVRICGEPILKHQMDRWLELMEYFQGFPYVVRHLRGAIACWVGNINDEKARRTIKEYDDMLENLTTVIGKIQNV